MAEPETTPIPHAALDAACVRAGNALSLLRRWEVAMRRGILASEQQDFRRAITEASELLLDAEHELMPE
jgi:hypothetical protein